MKKFTKAYLIVRKINTVCGHGDSREAIELVKQGSWESGAPHPAFFDEDKAWGYIDENKINPCMVEVLPIEIQD